MIHARLLFLLASLASAPLACGPKVSDDSSQTQEIAVSHAFDYALYFRDHGDVVRASCDPTRQVYDHSTCNIDPVRIPAGLFYKALDDRFTAGIQPAEQTVADLHARIASVDQRLLELLTSSPRTPDPALEPAIHVAEAKLAEASRVTQELRDQVARVAARAAEPGADPDLYLQLAELKDQLGQAIAAEDRRHVEVAAARRAYVQANSALFDQTMFNALTRQRDQLVFDLGNAEDREARQAKYLTGLARTINMLEDTGTPYVQDRSDPNGFGNGEILDAFNQISDLLDRKLRTFSATGAVGATSVQFTVDRTGIVEYLSCQFQQQTSSSCHDLEVTTPAGVVTHVDNWMEVRDWANYPHPEIFHSDPKGVWKFRIRYLCDGTAPAIDNAPPCVVGLKSAHDSHP